MTQQNDPGEEQNLPPASPPNAVPVNLNVSQPSNVNLPEPRVRERVNAEVIAPAPDNKESFLKKYLRNAGKAMIVFAVLGCCFLMFAAFMLISTFNRIFDALK